MTYKPPLVLTDAGGIQRLQSGDTPITGQHVIDALGYTPASGGGGSRVVVVDFGLEGTHAIDVVLTGLTGITLSNIPFARFELTATADHSVNDHTYAAMFCSITCGNIVADTGFTLYLRTLHRLTKTFNVRWQY